MFLTTKIGPVTLFKMGRSIGKYVPYHVHSFLIGDTLIDTGTSYVENEFLAALNGQPISALINTHHHEDHIGNNLAVQKAFGVRIFAHSDAIPKIGADEPDKLRFYQTFVWGRGRRSTAEPIPDVVHTGGCNLEVIPTPGHAPGHICLWEPQSALLFTGDMFCGVRDIYMRHTDDFHLWLRSLKKLAELPFESMFCSLKGYIKNGSGALGKKISFMEGLKEKVFALHGEGLSPTGIKQKILGREDTRFLLTGGNYSKQNLIDSILSRPDL
ncbi:MAG: MBL fold metallo-hydrolase [Proteobacteria bacterium]|nr:MBL fold metallo-hydrolase [Pseudomonadota bacterium]